MASGSSLTVNSVEERLKNGELVYYLNFRFSVGHDKGDLLKVRTQIENQGWQKLPDLESSYVWFGNDANKPPEVTDILKKASFENHVCRYMTGKLTDIGMFEGTGTRPPMSEGKPGQHTTIQSSTIKDYFPKA